jgi:putative mRNA 3-end processing factor
MSLIEPSRDGLYCAAGDFHIDPWRPVPRALVTHAHSDHARWGCDSYLCSATCAGVLRERIGREAQVECEAWGKRRNINGVQVSFHPAGHILGSAQIRVERKGEVWVVSGDYKTERTRSCESFEPVRCHTFITECTFGLPVYRWPPAEEVLADIHAWWRKNQEQGMTSVIFAYALGKAQRILAELDPSIGPIGVHGAIPRYLPHYAAAGFPMPEVIHASKQTADQFKGKGLILAPGSAANTPWMRSFGKSSLAFASGWMRIRGARRWRALDRGFVLSDHVDWPSLLGAIRETGASRVGATHGQTAALIRYLREEECLEAFDVPTRYTGESIDEAEPGEAEDQATTGDLKPSPQKKS